jgi:hypothetical protein
MRQFVIAAAIAIGLVAIWAVILPLTAQPAPTSPAMAKALFLCRGPNGVDSTCAAALARALVLEQPGGAVRHASDRTCPVSRQLLASLEQHD